MRIFLMLALMGVSCITAFAAGQRMAANDSLLQFNDRFNQSAAAGDAEALVGLYDEQSLWIEQGKAVAQGLAEPRKLFEFVTNNQGEVSHTVDHLYIADDESLAVMIGSVDAKVEKANLDATGTYLFVLRPDGQSWKIVTDMWHQHIK